MKLIKTTMAISLLTFSLSTQAQNKELQNAFNQSYTYETSQNYEGAITAMNSVYNASSYEMNLRLGWLNYEAGKYKESISFYEKAAALMPASVEAYWAMITVYTKQENWKEIEKTYLSILKIDSKNATANYNLGYIYYYRKDYVNAKKHFDICLNLYPFNYNYMLMSGWSNYFLGNKNEAVILFNKTLLYSPNDKSALEGLSLIK